METTVGTCLTDEDRTTLPALRLLELRAVEYFAALSGLHVRRRLQPVRGKAEPSVVFDISRTPYSKPDGVTRIQTRVAGVPRDDEPIAEWRPVPGIARDPAEQQRLLDLVREHGCRVVLTSAPAGTEPEHFCTIIMPDSKVSVCHAGASLGEAVLEAFVEAVERLPLPLQAQAAL